MIITIGRAEVALLLARLRAPGRAGADERAHRLLTLLLLLLLL